MVSMDVTEEDRLGWDVRDLLSVGLLGAEGRPRHGSDAVGKEESGSDRELHVEGLKV